MIGLDTKVTDVVVGALVAAGMNATHAAQIEADNHATCVAQLQQFREDHQDLANRASGIPSAHWPAPPNPRYDHLAWSAAFRDLAAWARSNLVA